MPSIGHSRSYAGNFASTCAWQVVVCSLSSTKVFIWGGMPMLHQLPTQPVEEPANKPLLEFITNGFRTAGCRILFSSPPEQVPIVITTETPSGERIGIIAYAFLLTRTTRRRAVGDRRSFECKCDTGRKDTNLWIDRHGLHTTLLIGIDPLDGFFVSADPAMHDTPRSFTNVVISDKHVQRIRRSGWYAWEWRPPSRSGLEEPIEVLVGGNCGAILSLVCFERIAHGLSPGDRHLLAETTRCELFTS